MTTVRRAGPSSLTFPDTLRDGYTTGPDYRLGARYEWVCEECFSKLKDHMKWSVGKDDAAGGNVRP